MPSKEIYRDMYSRELFGLRWDETKYEVHHLDCNHNHNVIDNLVLLPSTLHKKLHGNYGAITKEEALKNLITLDYKDDFIRNSLWAKLQFNHDFEKYLKLFSLELYEKWCSGEEKNEKVSCNKNLNKI